MPRLILLLIPVLFSTYVAAQSPWLLGTRDSELGISIQKPKMNGRRVKDTYFSMNYLGYFSYQLNKFASVFLDVPVSHASLSSGGAVSATSDTSETSLGNVGLFASGRILPFAHLDVGTRIPLVNKSKTVSNELGRSADLQDPFKFTPDALPLYGLMTLEVPLFDFGLWLGGSAGSILVIQSESEDQIASEDIYIKYNVALISRPEYSEIHLGFNSLGDLSSDLEGQNRFLNSFYFNAEGTYDNKVTIGAHFKIYLNNTLEKLVSSSLGLQVSYLIPG